VTSAGRLAAATAGSRRCPVPSSILWGWQLPTMAGTCPGGGCIADRALPGPRASLFPIVDAVGGSGTGAGNRLASAAAPAMWWWVRGMVCCQQGTAPWARQAERVRPVAPGGDRTSIHAWQVHLCSAVGAGVVLQQTSGDRLCCAHVRPVVLQWQGQPSYGLCSSCCR
jgi:hypothetical protein